MLAMLLLDLGWLDHLIQMVGLLSLHHYGRISTGVL